MATPILSVLLPNFNNAPFLRECLDSLYNQTFQDFIIFFVDDCSTDNSVEIAASYPQEKMVIIRKDRNSGIVDTMNAGLDQIVSKYFIRMDGDDINKLDRFEKLVEFMEANPKIDVCTSNIETFGTEKEIIYYEKDALQNKANLIFSHTIGHPSSIFRTSTLKDHGITYLNDFWRLEDFQLFYRMKDIAQFSALDQILYLYRRGAYNINDEIHAKKIVEYKKIYSMIFNDLKLDFQDEDLEIHLELAGIKKLTKDINKFKNHVHKLIESNSLTRVFPDKELKICLNRALMRVCFWSVDNKSITLIKLLPFITKNRKLLKYYLIKKVRG